MNKNQCQKFGTRKSSLCPNLSISSGSSGFIRGKNYCYLFLCEVSKDSKWVSRISYNWALDFSWHFRLLTVNRLLRLVFEFFYWRLCSILLELVDITFFRKLSLRIYQINHTLVNLNCWRLIRMLDTTGLSHTSFLHCFDIMAASSQQLSHYLQYSSKYRNRS